MLPFALDFLSSSLRSSRFDFQKSAKLYNVIFAALESFDDWLVFCRGSLSKYNPAMPYVRSCAQYVYQAFSWAEDISFSQLSTSFL
jgi:hypothetical protein